VNLLIGLNDLGVSVFLSYDYPSPLISLKFVGMGIIDELKYRKIRKMLNKAFQLYPLTNDMKKPSV
jgi:hypothetical protein